MMEKILVRQPSQSIPLTRFSRIAIGMSIGFAALYLSIGLLMLSSDRYRASGIHDNDLFFQADSRYAVENLTETTSHYKRVHLHPTFVMMFNPLGQVINAFTHQPQLTASILCALFGGLNVGLLFYFFTLMKLPLRWSVVFAVMFGLSSMQLVFSVLPDTYIFSGTGVILLLIAGAKKWKIQYWALITAYLLGITITNVVPAVLATFFFVFSGRIQQVWEQRSKFIQYCTLTGGVTVALSIVQKLIYDLWIFTFLHRVDEEHHFMFIPSSFSEGIHRVIDLAEHFFVFNVVAPFSSLVDHSLREGIELLSFRNSSLLSYSLVGSITVLLWLTLIGMGLHIIIKYQLYQLTFIKVFSLILLFHFTLHFLYGDDLMLYTAHWTAILFGLGAYALRSIRFFERYPSTPFIWAILFCVLLAANNADLMYDMVMAFHQDSLLKIASTFYFL